MKRLYLLRHGVTEANQKGIYCGQTESDLVYPDEFPVLPNVDKVVSSPSLRCRRYAERYPHESVMYEESLREIHFGEWEGLTFNDVNTRYPYAVKKYLQKQPSFRFPGGESVRDLTERVLKYLECGLLPLYNEHDEILLITHEGVVKTLLIVLLEMDRSKFWNMKISNLSFTSFDLYFYNKKTEYILTGINKKSVSE